MGRFTRAAVFPGKRWLLCAAVKASVSFVILVSAASISVTTSNFQAEFGSAFNVANHLLATDKGFSLDTSGSQAAGTNCSSPVTFGPVPGTANTTITAGHLAYDVQVSTSGAQPSAKYNVTLVMAQNTYGPFCIATPASPVDGQMIDCRFDVGPNLPASPFSFKVTVQ